MSRFILVLSDLHTGGAYSLMPRDATLSTGSVHQLNMGQEYLLSAWENMKEKLPLEIDVTILNGDLIDGINYHEAGRGINEPDPLWQCKHAAVLLKPILERSKLVINLAGTAYHTGKGLQAELTLSALLNLDHPYIWYHKNIDKNTYLDIAHRQSFGKRSRASSLESEIGYLLERKARAREILPRQAIIIRSHTHAGYRSIDEDGIIAISTPSWKIQDHF